jgi:hypothetical protein
LVRACGPRSPIGFAREAKRSAVTGPSVLQLREDAPGPVVLIPGERAMSPVVLILIIVLIFVLAGGGYGYRRGNNALAGGGGILGILLVIVLILFLMGYINV